ncbi:630_t:CDS:2, partial [Paraglomus occultum]
MDPAVAMEVDTQDSSKNKTSEFDPYYFDLFGATEDFIQMLEQIRVEDLSIQINFHENVKILKSSVTSRHDASKLLNSLSIILLHPSVTLHVVKFYRPLLIDLVSRWLLLQDQLSIDIMSKVELVAHAFAVILPIAPQLSGLAFDFFSQSPSLFAGLHTHGKYLSASKASTRLLQRLLLTGYRLLKISRITFTRLWNWSPIYQLLSHSDAAVRFLSVICLSYVLDLSDTQRLTATELWVGPQNEKVYMAWEDGVQRDIGMLTLLEQETLAKLQMVMLHNDFKTRDTAVLNESDLSPFIVNVSGVLLSKKRQEHVVVQPTVNERLALTNTTRRNLRAICLAVSIGSPILLEGITGCGKSALVEEVARLTGRASDLVKIHLGDQTDSKALLGTYVSTATPAVFRWQPGVLTTAVKKGRWVLIEDIELASAEVMSVLIPLLETRQLFIPSRGERIEANEEFQLFATRSLLPDRINGANSTRAMNAEITLGKSLWTKIRVESLTIDELASAIEHKFPNLSNLVPVIMRVYNTVISMYQSPKSPFLSTSSSKRLITTRDLMKWCKRLSALLRPRNDLLTAQSLTQGIREDFFSEAADCFCGMISEFDKWVKALEYVGDALEIPKERVRLYASSYVPTINVSDKVINIGRAYLEPMLSSNKYLTRRGVKKKTFANTSHSLQLMERLAVCVHLCEPVLLVGETGTGKTTVVQHLADLMNQNLVVVNLSQQSDSSDLLGGFKPVDAKVLATPLKEEFEMLFKQTLSVKKNQHYLDKVHKMFVEKKYDKVVALLKKTIKTVEQQFEKALDQQREEVERDRASKILSGKPASPELRHQWKKFANAVNTFAAQQEQIKNKLAFSYIEGSLVKAVIKGDWILLDEINLASTETLECLSSLLQDAQGSLLLTEKGDAEPIKRHPNFRMFACMNPATDVGKRDLPPGLRNRFTEFYIHPPDSRRDDLLVIVQQYLAGCVHNDEHSCMDVVEFYLAAKNLLAQHKLVDGANQRPHFSMRTLARALSYVAHITPTYGLRRSLYEGFSMTFLTQLNQESEDLMRQLVEKFLLRGLSNPRALITQTPRQPRDGNYIQFGHFWLECGSYPIEDMPHYIITPSVEKKLNNLARVVMSRKYPVLIQGPTSAGKTSMIEYLAKRTGHRFVRINNHEHTDLQEYLGTYISNAEGKLQFQEGVLIEALKNGYWIVLDELNLAPSDVLEALNRLLDDNRELLIPETQEVVRPHKDFMLFATQNPPGVYGGRKILSRAFRNRFLELHFDDIPEDELETILAERCAMAPSYCKRLVQVYRQLIERRSGTRIFERKHGFITLRDLFRWAGRGAVGYQELAEHGYMLLAERLRKPEEKAIVKSIIESVMKVEITEGMYDCSQLEEFKQYLAKRSDSSPVDVVWTKSMKRLFTLVSKCLRFDEPVLLVGETGSGKTTVCQILADVKGRALHIVNCHQNTETADLLGGQRPMRNRSVMNADLEKDRVLFEWHDGPLVQAMKRKEFFLLDEISLADDSVLERLNSVLEPQRLLVLPEKGGQHVEELIAAKGFQFLATMNPGGDYGKKELSPALRNRFTEIWVPSVVDYDDLLQIIDAKLKHSSTKRCGKNILAFIEWYSHTLGKLHAVTSLRDILSWVSFINTTAEKLGPAVSFVHGGCMVLLDGLGSNTSPGLLLSGEALKQFRNTCLRKLVELSRSDVILRSDPRVEWSVYGQTDSENMNQVESHESTFGIHPFYVSKGPLGDQPLTFQLLAPTTCSNTMRILRAMQLNKSILLEGTPGIGKTGLVTAIAAATGHRLIRINLSEQTDLTDLFGSDLPVEGGSSGEFAWRDAPFLQAMQTGDWVLLDELNLASQSVLEGLNSCLDHRASVYIPELDREFSCSSEFRVFGAQNPLNQGGGRKGLPKSFVNRFTQVFIEPLTKDDMLFICRNLFPEVCNSILTKMVEFNTRMYEETMVKCSFARNGSPWEFNLRDVFRWLELMKADKNYSCPETYFDIIYLYRLRTEEDRVRAIAFFNEIFDGSYTQIRRPAYEITPDHIQIGRTRLLRRSQGFRAPTRPDLHLLQSNLLSLEVIMKCVAMDWIVVLTGADGTGKTSLVRYMASLTGNRLEEFAMNSSVDTVELLGGFEQLDIVRHRQTLFDDIGELSNQVMKYLLSGTLRSSSKDDLSNNILTLRQLNDAFFVMNSQYKLSAEPSGTRNTPKLDYNVIEHLLSTLRQIMSRDSAPSLEVDGLTSTIEKLYNQFLSVKKLESEQITGRFEWIDGVLIKALQNGHWLLIDNANLCNPSVLDRLNPLLEPNGVLMVNERGLVDGAVQIIRPHKNFRLFMTVDPHNGELSRAMRNRGVEIALLSAEWSSNRQDAIRLTNCYGLRGLNLPSLLIDLHNSLKQNATVRDANPRSYSMMIRFIVERLQRGDSFMSSLRHTLQQFELFNEDVNRSFFEELDNLVQSNEPHALLNDVNPTNFPMILSGSFFEEESSLAAVCLYGAYFMYLLHKYTTCEDEQSASDIIPSIHVACEFLVEKSLSKEAAVYIRWLDFLSSTMVAARESKTRVDVIDFAKYFITVLLNHPLALRYAQQDNVKASKAFALLKRYHQCEYVENVTYQQSMRRRLSKLNIAQESFAYHEGRLTETSHPTISSIYLFFESSRQALKCCIDDWMKFQDIETLDLISTLLDQRKFVWNLCSKRTNLDVAELSACMQMLRETATLLCEQNDQYFSVMLQSIEDVTQKTRLKTGTSMGIIWKKFHSITLPDKSLSNVEQAPLNLSNASNIKNSIIEYWSILREMQIFGQLAFLESRNLKSRELELSKTLENILHLCEVSSQRSTRPASDFVAHKRLLWIYRRDSDDFIDAEAELVFNNIIQDILYGWHTRLWNYSLKGISESMIEMEKSLQIEGPSALFQSIYATTYFAYILSLQSISVESYNESIVQHKELLKHISSCVVYPVNRRNIDFANLIFYLRQILFVHHEQLFAVNNNATNMLDRLSDVASSLLKEMDSALFDDKIANVLWDVFRFIERLEDQINIALKTGLVAVIRLLLDLVSSTDEVEALKLLGQAWIAFSLCFVTLYIPDYPLDPTNEERLRANLFSFRQDNLKNQIVVRQEIEYYYTGESSNTVIEMLENDLDKLKVSNHNSSNLALRPERSLLDDLFKHVYYLRENVIDQKHVESLLSDLQVDCDSDVLQREQLFQARTWQFIQRTSSNYPLYYDLLQPLFVALYQLKFGVRLVTSACLATKKNKNEDRLQQIIIALLECSIRGRPHSEHLEYITQELSLDAVKAIIFSQHSASKTWDQYLEYLCVVLNCIYHRVAMQGHLTLNILVLLDRICLEIARIYLAAEDQQKKIAEEKGSLYRRKTQTHDIARDDERDEQDFKKMFPDFSQEIEVAVSTDEDKQEIPAAFEDSEIFIVNNNILTRIGTLHARLFADFDFLHKVDIPSRDNLTKQTFFATSVVVSSLASLNHGTFTEKMDSIIVPSQLLGFTIWKDWLSHGVGPEMSGTTTGRAQSYDFYKDANIPEARRIIPALSRFQVRIIELLKEWPEHAVLQQLDMLCDRIKGFSLTSPIAKFLTGLEILLQKSEEWEAYASRDVSVSREREDLSSLVVSWRQLELTCWPNLLVSQEIYNELSVYKWWFHLYNSVLRPIDKFNGDILDEVGFNEHITKVLEILDEFLQSSKLGDFHARLNLVYSFSLHLRAKVYARDAASALIERAYDSLLSIHNYYCQFLNQRNDTLGILRKPIEKELKDFVKLASWKDVNIHALKQSAQKTHRQLHKCIRKYREVLETPITIVITAYQNDIYTAQSTAIKDKQLIIQSRTSADAWILNFSTSDFLHFSKFDAERFTFKLPSRFVNISHTFARLQSYCRDDILLNRPRRVANTKAIDEFATYIIQRIKTLQEETSAVTKEDNKSLVKSQKMVKKKSLVDLLRELKRIGLNHFAKKLAQKQQDLVGYMLQLPCVELEYSFRAFAKKALLPDVDSAMLLWSRSADYYYKIIARMTHLRTIANTNPSKDLTSQEVTKGLGFAEHLLHLIVIERKALHTFEQQYTRMIGMLMQLKHLSSTFDDLQSPKCNIIDLKSNVVADALKVHSETLDDLIALLSNACLIVNCQKEGVESLTSNEFDFVEQLKDWLERIQKARDRFNKIYTETYLIPKHIIGSKPLVKEDLRGIVQEDVETIKSLCAFLTDSYRQTPQFKYIMSPISDFIVSKDYEIFIPTFDKDFKDDVRLDENVITSFLETTADFIDGILVAIQELRKSAQLKHSNDQLAVSVDEPQMADGHLRQEHNHFLEAFKELNPGNIFKKSERVYEFLDIVMNNKEWFRSSTCRELVVRLLQRVYPFVHQYVLIMQYKLLCNLAHHKSVCKLTYVLVSSFTVIFSRGFCTPNMETEVTEEGDTEKNVQGTGIGEGEGTKDVSDEIEDEEQVLGTQDQPNEPDSDNKRKNDDDKNKEIGKLDDADPDIVDEKMWDDKSVDGLDESDKTVNNDMNTCDNNETDIVAKNSDNISKSEDKQKKERKDQPIHPDQDPSPQIDEQEENEDFANEVDGRDAAQTDSVDIEVPEAETLDLPDNMNLDDMEDEHLNDMDDKQADEGNDFENMDIDDEQKFQSDNDFEETQSVQDQLDPMDTEDVTDEFNKDTERELPTSENNQYIANEGRLDPTEQGVTCGMENEISETGGESQTSNQQNFQPVPSSETRQTTNEEQLEQTSSQAQGDTRGYNNTQDDKEEPKKKQGNVNANPHRNLGDALAEWRRRLQSITDGEESNNTKENEQGRDEALPQLQDNENQAFEYIRDDETAYDAQALGTAVEDQVKSLDAQAGAIDEDIHIDESKFEYAVDESDNNEDIIQRSEIPYKERLTSDVQQQAGAILNHRTNELNETMDHDYETALQTLESIQLSHKPLPQEEVDQMRQELEKRLSDWRENGRDINKARELWQKYEHITYDLAYGLCEQLRLILEPTLAARLKGDYRTGKRLNMKRIIPYIASDFKKDKIWLRRTKCSKRQYQVMIAVDDSRSMCESHSIQLAYETLALISRALSQLEVGDISIVSFGERVQLLHPFDQPFTSETGAQVLQQFTFDQGKTYVKSFMETAISLLEHARTTCQGSRNSELWQLLLIISDGVCEDHTALRSLVRRAAESQIMTVFIIVDNKGEKDSIISMNHVKYKMINGSMVLQMERYLDTFPFDYYVVLRDINALTETLSDALRQYFTMI